MLSFKTKAKIWGNSIGIVIPREIVAKAKIKSEKEIIVEIKPRNVLKETFGTLKEWEIDSQKVKDELRKEWS